MIWRYLICFAVSALALGLVVTAVNLISDLGLVWSLVAFFAAAAWLARIVVWAFPPVAKAEGGK